jgi:hypothetical protein
MMWRDIDVDIEIDIEIEIDIIMVSQAVTTHSGILSVVHVIYYIIHNAVPT